MLTKEFLLTEYNSFKNRAEEAFFENKYEQSLEIIRYCAYIAWMFPILYRFIDDELESLLRQIAEKIIQCNTASLQQPGKSKKAVLYAGQLIDSGALTEQYLHFLIENEYQILLVVPYIANTVHAPDTLKWIEKYSQIELYIPKETHLVSTIRSIHTKIIEFDPHICLLHFLPNDVIGFCVFSQIQHIRRLYIVHNDHTFWLGKGCSDVFLEFRKFGYLIARDRREISTEKLRILPYYPINNHVEFQGLPFDRSGKIVGISGANLYKYLGDPSLSYLYAIKDLLLKNKDFIFCLCGWGDTEKIIPIFNDERIKERFYFLGKRNDFYALVGNCDILFESYPFKGGLTVLFATEQNIPVIGITNNKNASGSIQDLLGIENYTEPVNIQEFLNEAEELIRSKEKRIEKARLFADNKFNKIDFTKTLQEIITETPAQPYQPCFVNASLELDDEYFLSGYLNQPDMLNGFYKSKLFLLKRNITFLQRYKIFKSIYRSIVAKNKYKDVLRLFIVTIIGR